MLHDGTQTPVPTGLSVGPPAAKVVIQLAVVHEADTIPVMVAVGPPAVPSVVVSWAAGSSGHFLSSLCDSFFLSFYFLSFVSFFYGCLQFGIRDCCFGSIDREGHTGCCFLVIALHGGWEDVRAMLVEAKSQRWNVFINA